MRACFVGSLVDNAFNLKRIASPPTASFQRSNLEKWIQPLAALSFQVACLAQDKRPLLHINACCKETKTSFPYRLLILLALNYGSEGATLSDRLAARKP